MLIPLSVSDAVVWDRLGGTTGFSIQLMLWESEAALARMMPAATLAWWRERTHAGRCGKVAIRASVRLLAIVSGVCQHLKDDKSCGIYDQRPTVCRSYPVEANEPPSDQAVYPAETACPKEAWSVAATSELPSAYAARDAYQAAWVADQPLLRRAAALLGHDVGSIPSDADILHGLPQGRLEAVFAEATRQESSNWWKVAVLDHELGRSLHRRGAFVVGEVPTALVISPGLTWRQSGKMPTGLYEPPRKSSGKRTSK